MRVEGRRNTGSWRGAPSRRMVAPATVALAAALLALPGCSAEEWGTPVWQQSSRPGVPGDSLTIRRVLGEDPPVTPLTREEGYVQPMPEAPRATLANPEEALRSVPPYQPEGARPATPPQPPPGEGPPPRRPRRGSSSAPPMPTAEYPAPAIATSPPLPQPALPLASPPRTEGRVIPYPGGNAVTTTGTDRYETYSQPGTAGGGVVVRDGGPMMTIVGPDGRIHTVPAPPPPPR